MITGTTFSNQPNLVKHTAQQEAPHLRTEEKTFLYIGKSANKTEKCLSFFDKSYNAASLFLAKEQLLYLHSSGQSLPDVIIVDIPFNQEQLSKFGDFLNSSLWSSLIPVVYNETALNKKHLAQLKFIGLADDIVNIGDYCNELYKKASFLKKVKSHSTKGELEKTSIAATSEINNISFLKRAFDILISTSLLIILSPLFILIFIAIKLESKGPAIYTSKRAGRGFKVFNFLKFRTDFL